MAKAPVTDTRDVMEIDWAFFGEVCRALALKVARDFDPEVVLGIAKAGVMPGVVVASILQREFASMVVSRTSGRKAPVLVAGPPATIRGRRVLVVDETCESGSTMKVALSEVRLLQPAEVRTAVSFKTGPYLPDYHAFETDKFIILPWDREIVVDGELVPHPEYAARRP
ncbi:MAG TPA: phosphoribosyltransferase family protein [Gemmatimonadales bacterium]|nr:phosphoribosyltransferase family protein [Gemmatimonadales bacterium]